MTTTTMESKTERKRRHQEQIEPIRGNVHYPDRSGRSHNRSSEDEGP